MKKFLLSIALIASLLISGCSTTPVDASAKTLASTVQAVDSAMTGYAQWVKINKVSPLNQVKVRQLYIKYQAAEQVAESAILAAKRSGDVSGLQKSEAALNAAKLPLLELIALITTK